jgi:hypothetical protein
MIALLAAATTAADAQFPAQPPPVKTPMDRGNDQEQAACHPDVTRYCQTQLAANPDDILGILGCLQSNRAKISTACQRVLASHGQ